MTREREVKCRAVAHLRLDPEATTVETHEALGHGQADPGALVRRPSVRRSEEALEELRQLLLRYAGAGIAHGEPSPAFFEAGTHGHGALVGGEADRVLDEAAKDLEHALLVAEYGRIFLVGQLGEQDDLLVVGQWTRFLRRRLQEAAPDAKLIDIDELGFYELLKTELTRDQLWLELVSRFVREVNHPSLRMMYDSFHAHIEEKNQADAIRSCAADTIHVHVSENDRGVPGTGQVDWDGYWSALNVTGFNGYVTIEAFGRALPALAAATRVWRDLFPDAMGLCRDGLAFIKSKTKA